MLNLSALVKLFERINKEEQFVQSIIHQNSQKEEEVLVYKVWNENIEHFMNVTPKQAYFWE